jgi:hypothetical protein
MTKNQVPINVQISKLNIPRFLTAKSLKHPVPFAVPLIPSLDKADYTAVQFVADGKPVMTIKLQGPIENLVMRLSADPLGMNGMASFVKLPPTTATDALVWQALDQPSSHQEPAGRHHILKTTDVRIQGDPYTAILVETNQGEKIVLVKFMGVKNGWWSRVYDGQRSQTASDAE